MEKAAWTRTGRPWFEEAFVKRHHALSPEPTLTEGDKRPVAGRILGPTGDVLSVVYYGPEPPTFGFTA